jgi:hypothetical protein
MKLEAARSRGRPRKRWFEGFADTKRVHNITDTT